MLVHACTPITRDVGSCQPFAGSVGVPFGESAGGPRWMRCWSFSRAD
jgi:hypothetical protein